MANYSYIKEEDFLTTFLFWLIKECCNSKYSVGKYSYCSVSSKKME